MYEFVEVQKRSVTLENSVEFEQKAKPTLATLSSLSPSRYAHQMIEAELRPHTYTSTFMAALLEIAKKVEIAHVHQQMSG